MKPPVHNWLKALLALPAFLFFYASLHAQCPAPSNLSFTPLSPTSATLNWTSGGASNWAIEYGPAGFTQGTGTNVAATSTSTIVSGLTPNLMYDFYVKDSCGVSSVSSWTGPDSMHGTVVLCDDFDDYSLQLAGPQSVLIQEWAGAGGDAVISDEYSNSSPHALKIYDSGPATFSDVVAAVGTTTSGIHSVKFDFFVPDTFGGYYNILHNYVGTGTNVWAIEVYLDSNGTATVNEGSNGAGVIGTYQFNVGQWNTVEHIIDLDSDTAFILINGSFTDVGWQFSLGSTNFGDQFNAVNFFSAANVGQTPLTYFDNFCMTLAPVNDVGVVQFDAVPPICGDSSYGVPVVIRNNAMNDQTGFDVEVDFSGSSTGTLNITYNDVLQPGQLDTIEMNSINTLAGGNWNLTAYTELIGDTDPSNDTVEENSVPFLQGVSAEFGPEDTTFCDNQNFSMVLNAQNSGATYTWNTGATSSSVVADSGGIYAVTVTANNGCTASDQIELIELEAPIVDIGPDINFCEGQLILFFLNAGNFGTGSTYIWSNGLTTQVAEFTTIGIHSVTVENTVGCTTTDSAEFILHPAPVIGLNDISICGGDTGILDAGSQGVSYVWSEAGETDQTLKVVQSGTYYVTVSDLNSCSAVDSAEVTVNIIPFVMLGADTSITQGQSLTLDAGFAGSTYEWNTSETTQTINVTTSGTYTVTVTDENGCSGTDEIVVDVKVGIQGLSESTVRIYPNPAREQAWIELDASGSLDIQVFSLEGRKLAELQHTASGDNTLIPIDFSNYSEGVYFIQLRLDGIDLGMYRILKVD